MAFVSKKVISNEVFMFNIVVLDSCESNGYSTQKSLFNKKQDVHFTANEVL